MLCFIANFCYEFGMFFPLLKSPGCAAHFACRKASWTVLWLISVGLFFPLWVGYAQPESGLTRDRFVWIFGWDLSRDQDVAEISKVLETAGRSGFNGAVIACGLDTLSKRDHDFFRRLDRVQSACQSNRLELIPSFFSIGYGGGALSIDPNLAEGLPVSEAPFVVENAEGHFVSDASAQLKNGGFEDFDGNRFRSFAFVDDPGKVSFVDSEIKHSGRASLRLQNFTENPYGHGRVMETVRVVPHRCYRVSLWVKPENLQPASAFRCFALGGDRDLAPREFHLPTTGDWQKVSFIFNSLTNTTVNLHTGIWGGKSGRLWLDDWQVEDAGPVNVLHRPGTPVRVCSENGAEKYVEGRDYAPLTSPDFNVWRGDSTPAVLKILPGSRIHDGDHLRVSWYHPLLLNDSQVTVCMAEPELYEIFEREAQLLIEHLHPRRVLLGTDEIRMGGTCQACGHRDMAELLGECVTKQEQILRRYAPDLKVYVWSDMFDPHHNAHGDYYLVHGDFTGSWKYVPQDVVMAVWGGEPNPKSLQFFRDNGFSVLASCYYDADNLDAVKAWIEMTRPMKNVRGFMFTTWERKYDLLPGFGKLLD